jgi:hypothetical protein
LHLMCWRIWERVGDRGEERKGLEQMTLESIRVHWSGLGGGSLVKLIQSIHITNYIEMSCNGLERVSMVKLV